MLEQFAGSVFDLMLVFHVLECNGCGLEGGASLAKKMKLNLKAEASKPKAGMIEGSTGDGEYIVKNCMRRFVIAADRLKVFDSSTTLGDVMRYLSDRTGQVEMFEKYTLTEFKTQFGCDTIF